MNPAVALVRTYLKLNSYFTATELPVIKRGEGGLYFEVTDIDILALRFPRAAHIVAQGRPGPLDDLHFQVDPLLGVPTDAMDFLIGEVKEGRPRLNPRMLSRDTLYRALVRFGLCPEDRMERVVEELRGVGHAWVPDEEATVPSRVRLVAFGDGPGHAEDRYSVVPLKHVASWVKDHLHRYREVLRSPGQPLDAATRGLMESRFGHDFSSVRIHSDAKAAEAAQSSRRGRVWGSPGRASPLPSDAV